MYPRLFIAKTKKREQWQNEGAAIEEEVRPRVSYTTTATLHSERKEQGSQSCNKLILSFTILRTCNDDTIITYFNRN